MKKKAMLLAVLLALISPLAGLGAQLGEPAPALTVSRWIQGDPVEIKPGTNIIVVEIWTTSSYGSKVCITNLNDLQRRYRDKGVVVVGITDEPEEKVRDFVAHNETKIEYTIAVDEARKTELQYMIPARQKSIPYAFVIGTNGALLWHGRPAAGLDTTLEHMVAGTFDLKRTRKTEAANLLMEQYLGLARRKDARTKAAGQALLAGRTNDVPLLCDLAYQISTAPRIPSRDWALAQEALNQADQLEPTNIQVMLSHAIFIFQAGKPDKGMEIAKQILASTKTDGDKKLAQSCIDSMNNALKMDASDKATKSGARGTTTVTNTLIITNVVTITNTVNGDTKK